MFEQFMRALHDWSKSFVVDPEKGKLIAETEAGDETSKFVKRKGPRPKLSKEEIQQKASRQNSLLQEHVRKAARSNAYAALITEALEDNREELEAIKSYWTGRAIATEPADRERLEHTIIEIYGDAGIELPRSKIIWLDSALDVAKAAIIISSTFSPYPSRFAQACIGGAAYGIHPELLKNRSRSYSLIHDIPHRWNLANETITTIDHELGLDDLNRCWSNLCRPLGMNLVDGTQRSLADLIREPRAPILRPVPLHGVLDKLRSALRDDQRCDRLDAFNDSWWAALTSNPIFVFECYFHTPLADAADLIRMDALRMLGFDVMKDDLFAEACDIGGWWVPFGEVCLACDNPSALNFDEAMRLHNDEGMAIEFEDGSGIWALHGVPVTEHVIKREFTAMDIDYTKNIELRRLMIERFGISEYIHASGVYSVARDEVGTLYSKHMPDDEPLKLVKVINKTAEPDGTFKTYFLRVPPTVITPKGAIAWTFGLSEGQYLPLVET